MKHILIASKTSNTIKEILNQIAEFEIFRTIDEFKLTYDNRYTAIDKLIVLDSALGDETEVFAKASSLADFLDKKTMKFNKTYFLLSHAKDSTIELLENIFPDISNGNIKFSITKFNKVINASDICNICLEKQIEEEIENTYETILKVFATTDKNSIRLKQVTNEISPPNTIYTKEFTRNLQYKKVQKFLSSITGEVLQSPNETIEAGVGTTTIIPPVVPEETEPTCYNIISGLSGSGKSSIVSKIIKDISGRKLFIDLTATKSLEYLEEQDTELINVDNISNLLTLLESMETVADTTISNIVFVGEKYSVYELFETIRDNANIPPNIYFITDLSDLDIVPFNLVKLLLLTIPATTKGILRTLKLLKRNIHLFRNITIRLFQFKGASNLADYEDTIIETLDEKQLIDNGIRLIMSPPIKDVDSLNIFKLLEVN